MRSYRISELLYWVIAVISAFQTVQLWKLNPSKAYIFLGFAVLSIFMALFRRHFRRKFNARNPK